MLKTIIASKHKVRRFTTLVLVFVLTLTGLIVPDSVQGSMPREDFESFATGPLNGQQTWIGDAGVSISEESAKSGTKSIKVLDESTTATTGMTYKFPTQSTGRFEWWAKPVTTSGLVAQIQSVTTSTRTAAWLGFSKDGVFMYNDGTTRVYMKNKFRLNTWYRFSVELDPVNKKFKFFIYGEDGSIEAANEVNYNTAGTTTVNQIRFATFGNEKATFFVDDVNLYTQSPYTANPDSLSVQPNVVSLQVGENASIHVLGHYPNGGLDLLTPQASYLSSHPAIADVVDGKVMAFSSGETSIQASAGGKQASTKVYVYGPGDTPPKISLEPRPLVPETDLTALKIFVPSGEPWNTVGRNVAQLIRTKWGIQAPVEVSDSFVSGSGWSGNTLVIGNLSNNAHMARLYGQRLAFADGIYPGAGGYQLQTLIDPFGLGGNTLLLGASDADGLAAGAGKLEQLLTEANTAQLPWLGEIQVNDSVWLKLPLARKPEPADLSGATAFTDSLLAGMSTDVEKYQQTLALLSTISRYGEAYQMTRDAYYGTVYKALLKGYAAFFNRNPDVAEAQLDVPNNMWVAGPNLVASWAVLEPDDMFTELERKQIISALFLIFEANNDDFYLNRDYAAVGAKYNHDVFPALSIWFGANYFQKYFPELSGPAAWLEKGEKMFANNTANINLDEGSDYMMHVPVVSLDYALASGNDRFLRQGLRASADLNSLMIDNLGTMSGGGDLYPFGRSSAYTWGHSNIMHAASWYFADPVYDFLMNRVRTGPFTGQNMSDLDYPFHRYMTDQLNTSQLDEAAYPKVKGYPVEQAVYNELQSQTPDAPLEVAQSDTFHKLAFREGFDQDDAYLLLDGFSAGTHGHEDGNTILKYSADGRIFIDDRDYIERGSIHHTGITVVKDGGYKKKPPFAELQWGADASGIGVSRSTVPNYNGTNWERQIIAPFGHFFLVYDKVTVKEPGSYLLENTWQTLGDPTLKQDSFIVDQQGAQMTIQSLDESTLSSYDRYGHFIKYYKNETLYPYPYAEQENVLRQVMNTQTYQPGESRTYINLLSSSPDGSSATKVTGNRLGDNKISVRQGGEEWLAIWGSVNSSSFSTDGNMHLLGENEWLIAEVTQARFGSSILSFNEPVILKVDLASGSWQAYSMRSAITHYDEQGNPVNDSVMQSGTVTINRIDADKWMRELKTDDHNAPQKQNTDSTTNYNYNWKPAGRSNSEISTAASGDLNGDGLDEVITAGTDGKIEAFSTDGSKLWSFQGDGRVNEVSVQKTGNTVYVFAATENFVLHAIDVHGTELWKYRFPDDAAHREMKGNLIGLTNVRLAYVNGQNVPPWIMVATQFRYLYGLNLEGQLVYEGMPEHYGIQDMEFLDTDADGKDEGILGMEYTSMVVWNEQRIGRAIGADGPGWTKVTNIPVYTPEAVPTIALGTKQNHIHVIKYNGSLVKLWSYNVGGEVTDIWAGDYDQDGKSEIVAGSEGHQVYSFHEDGTLMWKADVGDRVLGVDVVQGVSDSKMIITMDNGKLAELSASGELLRTYSFKQKIARTVSLNDGSEVAVVLKDGSVFKAK